MRAWFRKYILHFNRPAGTSRGILTQRTIWLLFLEENKTVGVGECAPLPGLSLETESDVEAVLIQIQDNPTFFLKNQTLFENIPSVRFAWESAMLDLQNGGNQILFPSDFTQGKKGIPINGLIWMGEPYDMQLQIESKLAAGYQCIKLKIGALPFEKELEILQSLRNHSNEQKITLRVDANGAYHPTDVLHKLNQLAKLSIHSIEQPIKAGNWPQMAELCRNSPVPIALDEELIGINRYDEKLKMIETIRPQYLVLKPSLHGGIAGCNEWIELSKQYGIGWWITSYLESNIGLNAIAQWAFTRDVTAHQGLGTGKLFVKNFDSPLELKGETLWYNPGLNFSIPEQL